jgi:ribonuclease P protein component
MAIAAEDHAALDLDVVVIGRRDILSAEYVTLIEDLRRALRAVRRSKERPVSGPNPAILPNDREPGGSHNA